MTVYFRVFYKLNQNMLKRKPLLILLLLSFFALNTSFGQDISLQQKGTVDVYYVHGDYNWKKIPKEKAIPMVFGTHGNRNFGQDEQTYYAMDNFESLVVHFRAWALIGDLIMHPTVYWSINKEFLRGEKHSVSYQKISKYPDLVKRYEAIRPRSFRAILGLGLNPEDKYAGGGYAWFKVNDNDVIIYASKKSPYTFPTAPGNIGQGMILKTDLPTNTSFSFVTDFNQFKVTNDKAKHVKHLNGVARVSGSYAYNELQKGTVKAIRTFENQNIYLKITWPLEAIDRIHETYLKYERGEASPLDKLNEEVAKDQQRPFGSDNEWAEPVEDDLKGIEPFIDYKSRRMHLQKPNGSIVKAFDMDTYSGLRKVNEKSSSYFMINSSNSGKSYQSRNNYHLLDKRGNFLKVNGEENFASIQTLDNGNLVFSKNTSESLYEDELFLGGNISGELFSSQSGAASAVRDHIRSVKEARRRKSSGSGVSIGWTNKYNVVKVKEIVTDAQLKVISSTEGYRIF